MSKENEKIVEEYIKQFNPSESHPSIAVDLVALTRCAKAQGIKGNKLRLDFSAYAAYLEENNLAASDITEEILSKFIIEPKQS